MLNPTPVVRPVGLHEYVLMHTEITPGPDCDCDIDVVFFKVNIVNDANGTQPDAEVFITALNAYRGTFGNPELHLLNGSVNNFIEIGAYMGDQRLALRMMALGAYLEVWRLMTPYHVGELAYDSPVCKMMAKVGLVAVVVEPSS